MLVKAPVENGIGKKDKFEVVVNAYWGKDTKVGLGSRVSRIKFSVAREEELANKLGYVAKVQSSLMEEKSCGKLTCRAKAKATEGMSSGINTGSNGELSIGDGTAASSNATDWFNPTIISFVKGYGAEGTAATKLTTASIDPASLVILYVNESRKKVLGLTLRV